MGIARSSRVAVLLLSGALTFALYAVSSKTAQSQTSKQQPAPEQTYAQVVRLSYVEGDVRISRGKISKESSGSDWEAAEAGLPIETGFNLVTGQGGRVEIEFEDASTVYLAENSALSFNDLHTTNGVPYTNLALLTGTATLYILHSPDTFILLTPTSRITPAHLFNSYFRITSYADGNAIAARANMAISLPDLAHTVVDKVGSGTIYYRGSTRIPAPEGADAQSFAAWDQWVDERVTARTAAMNAVMIEAGLTSPVPGLAELNGKGKFFSCEPYGTCWEPNDGAEPDSEASPASGVARGQARESMRPKLQTVALEIPGKHQDQSPAANAAGGAGQAVVPSRPQNPLTPNSFVMLFPCMPNRIAQTQALALANANNTGGPRRIATFGYDEPWDWARCHAGYWIRYRHHRRYTWVVGRKIHHQPPVRWVKYNGKVAFVPRNPKDEPGKPPLNLQHGVFEVKGKNGEPVQLTEYDPRQEIKLLNGTPKEFLKPVYAPLGRAAEPHPEVHSIVAHTLLPAGQHPGELHATELHATLAFDHKSESFLLARQVTNGGKTSTTLQPFAGRNGELQARAVGVDSHGNYNMHASSMGGGGRVGGGGGGAGSSGGGHFSGGGGVASSGGGHSSGGGGGGGASGGGSHK
jgi:hypothetical protein